MSGPANPPTVDGTKVPSEGPSEQRIAVEVAPLPAAGKLKDDSAPSRSRWFEILNSSVATTLITVLIGGIVGQLILSNYQDRQKNRETVQAELRGMIQKRQQIIQQALDLIGTARFDSEALIQLSEPKNDPRYFSAPLEKKEIIARRDKLLDNHSDVLRKWDVGRRETALLLAYYNFGDAGIKAAWNDTADATTAFLNCAQTAYAKSHAPGPLLMNPCSAERDSANDALGKLSAAFELANQSTWKTLKP